MRSTTCNSSPLAAGRTPCPVGRDLDRVELSLFVEWLAAAPSEWRHLVAHDPAQRVYRELWRDDHVVAWLICWMYDHDTGFHDHDLSAGAITVAAGRVCEERLAIGGPPLVRAFGRGETFDFAPSDIHRVLHVGDEPAVTLHAYSPPLLRMGAYEVREQGALARHSITYAEELRPR
jgi:hypothetical protein